MSPHVLPSRRPKCPVNPQVKHSFELTGNVPGRRGYGVDSVMKVPGPCVFAQSACCAQWACRPASVSGWCGYFLRHASSAALSACVARGLVLVFCGGVLVCGVWNTRFPRPPLLPAKGSVGTVDDCCSCCAELDDDEGLPMPKVIICYLNGAVGEAVSFSSC